MLQPDKTQKHMRIFGRGVVKHGEVLRYERQVKVFGNGIIRGNAGIIRPHIDKIHTRQCAVKARGNGTGNLREKYGRE